MLTSDTFEDIQHMTEDVWAFEKALVNPNFMHKKVLRKIPKLS